MRASDAPWRSAARWNMCMASAIALVLVFRMNGAILNDVSRTAQSPGEPADAALARADLANVWGPLVAHFGIFLFVLGLFAAAVYAEDLDVFVRLFLLIVAFVALLLVLANSPTIFG